MENIVDVCKDKFGRPMAPGDTVIYATCSGNPRFMVFLGVDESENWSGKKWEPRFRTISAHLTPTGEKTPFGDNIYHYKIGTKVMKNQWMKFERAVIVPPEFVPAHITRVLCEGQTDTVDDIYEYWKKY